MTTNKGQVKNLWEEFAEQVLDEIPRDSVQYTESRRIFYSACMRTLIYMRDEVAMLPDDIAVATMQAMLDEVKQFYKNEINRNNDLN